MTAASPCVLNRRAAAPVSATERRPDDAARIAASKAPRQVENATQRAEGFAGRADALVVAFAARRAIDRGVALGYLETLLVERFGAQHQQAVATIITASRQPVRLNDLIAEYETLRPGASARRAAGQLVDQFPPRARLADRGPPRRPARRSTPMRAIKRAHAAAVSRATSTRRSPRPCGCPAQPAPATGSPRRAAMSPPIARSTRSNSAALLPRPSQAEPLNRSQTGLGKRLAGCEFSAHSAGSGCAR